METIKVLSVRKCHAVNPVQNITMKGLHYEVAAIYCNMNHSSWASVDIAPVMSICSSGNISPIYPSHNVNAADTYRMLDPKRTRSFCNAFTAKKGHFININSRNVKVLYFGSGKIFHHRSIKYLGLRRTRWQGRWGCCIMSRLMICIADKILIGW